MAIRIRRILWPTDLSKLSLKGAKYAQALCEAFGSQLHVIHVTPVIVLTDPYLPVTTGGDMLVGTTDVVTPAKEELKKLLHAEFGRGAAKVKTEVRSGNAWRDICQYARKNAIDLIVMSTHGQTGLSHLVMGSTAERVVQHASCPVMTVKSFERDFVFEPGPRVRSKRRVQKASVFHLKRAPVSPVLSI